MSGKGTDDKARALLSKNALPKIEIPKSRNLQRREFKLPQDIKTPIPGRGDASAEAGDSEAPKRRRRRSTGRFKERTLGWFKTGEDMETQTEGEFETEASPSARPMRTLAIIGGGVAVVFALTLLWWLS